jgi:hypothetical protein
MGGKQVAYESGGNECGRIQTWESHMETLLVSPELFRTIEGEFAEMPGMRLTEAQFRRLWALDATDCDYVTTALMDSGVLARDADGRYCRRADLDD